MAVQDPFNEIIRKVIALVPKSEEQKLIEANPELFTQEGQTVDILTALELTGFGKTARVARTSNQVIRDLEKAKIDRAINSLKNRFPETSTEQLGQIRKRLNNQQINNWLKGQNAKTTKSLLKKYIGGIITVDVMLLWGAFDNVMSGRSIFYRDLDLEVKSGKITAEEASKLVFEHEELAGVAENFIKASALTNPLLIPFKNFIIEGTKAQKDTAEFHKKSIEAAVEEEQTKLLKEEEEREEAREKSATRFTFAEDATGGELFVPPKPRDTDPPRPAGEVPGSVGPGALRAKERPEREQPSKLGFGL